MHKSGRKRVQISRVSSSAMNRLPARAFPPDCCRPHAAAKLPSGAPSVRTRFDEPPCDQTLRGIERAEAQGCSVWRVVRDLFAGHHLGTLRVRHGSERDLRESRLSLLLVGGVLRRVRLACAYLLNCAFDVNIRRAQGECKPEASVRTGNRSDCGVFDDEVQAGAFRERPEVSISGQQRYSAINATLGEQGITETRFAASGKGLCSQRACALPVAGLDLNEWDFRQIPRHLSRKLGIAQQLGQDCRNHQNLPVLECLIEQLDVFA